MLFRADGMKKNIGGVILFDETLRQDAKDGTPLRDVISEQGALPGIKVDKGISPLDSSPEENITGGLEGLNERCAEYFVFISERSIRYESLGRQKQCWHQNNDVG